MNVNLFKAGNNSSKPESILLFQQYLENIKLGAWQDDVLAYRNGNFPKEKLPCITTSGTFSARNEKGLVQHSGFMCIDLDAKDQVVKFDIEEIKKDPYVYAVHQSVGGFGYAIFFRINPEKHKESYFGLEKYFLEKYKLIADPAPKNVASLRYVSYDPDIYINEKAKLFKSYPKKEKKQNAEFYPTTQNDFDEIVRQVTARAENMCEDYDVWIKFAFALASEFGGNGRNYFHAFSQNSAKYDYDKCNKMFDIALKRKGSGVSIATVYYYCKQAGINIVSEKTKKITQVVKLSENKEKAKITLEEMGFEQVDEIIDKIDNQEKERTELDEVVDLIKLSKVRFNEITRNYEFGKEPMTDRVLAKFYAKCWKLISDDLSKDKIFTLIENPENTTSYNPIRSFFTKYSHLKPKGNFDRLVSCFEVNHEVNIKGINYRVTDYLNVFLKKWLLSIIGSAHGTYSLMILVLNGKQGISKTEFFRGLLPLELREYYAESSLDEGKDSEILMTKKILIVDDEFGGKNKSDYKKLKNLSSKQHFSVRRPYGKVSEDLERIAVLGGTTNESEIINDYTGNRRIIPVNVVSFDIEKFRSIDKNDLFMELYHEWQQDRTGWFLTPEEIDNLNESTLKNQEVMAEQELITDLMMHSEFHEMTNTQIKLQLENKFSSFRTNTKRIGQALSILGYSSFVKLVEGKTQRVYKICFKG